MYICRPLRCKSRSLSKNGYGYYFVLWVGFVLWIFFAFRIPSIFRFARSAHARAPASQPASQPAGRPAGRPADRRPAGGWPRNPKKKRSAQGKLPAGIWFIVPRFVVFRIGSTLSCTSSVEANVNFAHACDKSFAQCECNESYSSAAVAALRNVYARRAVE